MNRAYDMMHIMSTHKRSYRSLCWLMQADGNTSGTNAEKVAAGGDSVKTDNRQQQQQQPQ
jgi:hypothetical protein